MRRSNHVAMMAVFLLSMLGASPGIAHAQSNVNGNVYTSPTFGYQLQWSDPWMLVEEETDTGVDYLLLSDGTSDAGILLGFAPGITVNDLVAIAVENPQPGAGNFQPMLDAQGNPVQGTQGTQEWVVYTGTQDLGDGSSVDFMQYFNVQPLEQGVAMMITITTVSFFWDDTTLQSWNELASTLVVGSTPGPPLPTSVPAAPTVPVAPTEVPVTLKPTVPAGPAGAGEPAPAFAAGPWRIAVRAVDHGQAIDYLSLGFVDGQQWVVVYADVTNWSAGDQQIDAAGWTLVTANGSIPPDVGNTQATASLLGLEPANGSSVTVPAGVSIRVALVYSIPASETDFILEVAGEQLPLDDAVGQQFDVTDLSTIATPPAMITGTLTGIPELEDGQPTFYVETTTGVLPVHLAGTDFTDDGRCASTGGANLEISVDAVPSQTVWLESDPAIPESDTYYVWIEDDDGNRISINQQMIVNGMAFEGDLLDSARFAAWLEQSEEIARSTREGFWALCS